MEQSPCSVPPTASKLQFSYCLQHFKQMIITHWQNQHRNVSHANEEQATPTKFWLHHLAIPCIHAMCYYFTSFVWA
jgi:hypothetical protein